MEKNERVSRDRHATVQPFEESEQICGGRLDPIFSNNAVVGITSTPGLPTSGEEIQTVQTFRRQSKNGGEGGFTSREFFVDERGLEGGSMMVQGHAEDVKFISNSAGGLLTAVNP